ncbi:MAG: Wzy polymerase domain-containing protein [Pseudomonas sp.]
MSNAAVSLRAFLLVLSVVGLGFCQPMHVYPIANFIEELLVAIGVLLIGGMLLWRSDRLQVSAWLMMWTVLGVLFAVSAWLHPAVMVSHQLMVGAFWFIGLLALLIGDQLDWQHDGERLSYWLAIALLSIALVCAIGGFLRYYGLLGATWRAYVPEPDTGRLTGLVGQSNFFAFISFFGLLALGWLHNARRVSMWLVLLSVLVLVPAIAGTGSRAVLVTWVASIVVLLWRSKVAGAQRWFLFMMATFVFYWAFRPVYYAFDHWFYGVVFKLGWVGGAGTLGSDVLARGAVSPQRLNEWRTALEIIQQHVWTGIGIGNYSISSFQQHLRANDPSTSGLFSHSHNSPLQLVIELGMAGLLWVLVFAGLAVRAFWRASRELNRLLPLLVVLTIQLYGMFEFPMWMMHFLTLNMVLLGALGGVKKTVPLTLGKPFAITLLAVALMFSLIYVPVAERFVWSYRQMFLRAEVDRSEYAFINSMMQDPLMEPYGYLLYFANYNLSPTSLQSEREALDRLEKTLPYPQVLVRSSLVHMAQGNEAKAQSVLADMRLFYGVAYEY